MIAVFLLIFLITGILGIAVLATSIIGLWKIFTKAGEEGWKAIVPFYNLYILTTIVGLSPYWVFIILGLSIISTVITPLATIAPVVYFYFGVILAGSITKSFGKDEMFGFGLFFLYPIFYLILGLDSSKYEGKKPMKDPVMDFINENILHKETNTTKEADVVEEVVEDKKKSQSKYCTNCGAELESDSAFCTSCGTKVE